MANPSDSLSIDDAMAEGLRHYQAGEFQQALGCYQAVLQADPGHGAARHNIGAVALRLDRPSEALRYFNEALRADPTDEQHWISLVQTLALTGQTELADTMLSQAAKQGVSEQALARMRQTLSPNQQIRDTKTEDRPDPDALVLPEPDAPTSQRKAAPRQEMKALESLIGKGEYRKAERQASALLKRFPGDAKLRRALGRILYNSGRLEKARSQFEQAAALNPEDPISIQNLAITYNGLSLPDRAVAAYRKALALQPDNTDHLLPYANALKACFRLDEAIQVYQQMIERNVRPAEAWNNVGTALRSQHQYAQAKDAFLTSIDLAPDATWAYKNLGSMLAETGAYAEALTQLDAALDREPDDLPTRMSRAQTLRRMGDTDAAIHALTAITETAPEHAQAYNQLKELAALPSDSTLFAKLQAIPDSPTATRHDQTIAWFVMGGVHLDEGNPEAAFEAYRQGNELVCEERKPNRIIDRQARKITEQIGKRFFNTRLPMGSDNTQPVFITGMPRSGKSLLEKLLAQSCDVKPAQEMDGLQDLLPGRGDGTYLLNHIQSITRRELNQRTEVLLRSLRGASGAESEYITETTPKTGAMPYYTLMFPRTPIIFCDRNPWDLMATCYFKYFRNGHSYAFDIPALEKFIRAEKLFMDHWLEVLPNPVMRVTYEELVTDPVALGRRLSEFLGIDWRDEFAQHVTVDGDTRGELPDANPVNSIDFDTAPVPLSTDFIGFGEQFREYFEPHLTSTDPFHDLS